MRTQRGFERTGSGFGFVILGTILLFFMLYLVSIAPKARGAYTNLPMAGFPYKAQQGDTITTAIPLDNLAQALTWNYYVRIWDATGTATDSTGVATAETSINDDPYLIVTYTPSVAGHLVLFGTEPTMSGPQLLSTLVEPAGNLRESTMYYLSSSVSRDETWNATSDLVRSSSAYYESILWETFANDQGDYLRHHVVVYDQATNISNYFQKGWHFWESTAAGIIEKMTRAVPDGDFTRYHYQGE